MQALDHWPIAGGKKAIAFVEDEEATIGQQQGACRDHILQTTRCGDNYVNLIGEWTIQKWTKKVNVIK